MPGPISNIKLQVSASPEFVTANLTGAIIENNRLTDCLGEQNGQLILMNLSQIRRINSVGIRDWVRWVEGLEARGNTLYFERCPPTVVTQVNLVSNFCGAKGQVVSFEAPYVCGGCGEEKAELLKLMGLTAPVSPPAVNCPSCQSPMKFDDLPKTYFAFVARHQARPLPSPIALAVGR